MTGARYSFLKTLITVASITIVMLFIYVFTLEEIKSLRYQKQESQELLNQKNNRIEELRVEIQKLSSEERITKIAAEKLGLVRNSGKSETLKINKDKINRIEELVNGRYE